LFIVFYLSKGGIVPLFRGLWPHNNVMLPVREAAARSSEAETSGIQGGVAPLPY